MIRTHVLICGGTGCTSSGSMKIGDKLEQEIARLREALEVILDAAQKDEPCVLAIKSVAYMALKEKGE